MPPLLELDAPRIALRLDHELDQVARNEPDDASLVPPSRGAGVAEKKATRERIALSLRTSR